MRRSKYLLLALLSALFCIAASPVAAQLPTVSLLAQAQSQPLQEQGRNLFEAGRFQEAVLILQQAVEAAQEQGDQLQQAISLGNLALTYQQLSQWNEANQAIEASLSLLQSLPQTRSDRLSVLAQTLDTQGNLQLAQGQAEQALSSWEQAIALYEQLDDSAGAIRIQINQAQAFQSLGLYQRAVTTLTALNQTLQAQPDLLIKAIGLRSLGDALRVAGDLNESHQVLQQSLAIAQQLQLPDAIAAAQLSLGNTARAQQDFPAALDAYQQAASHDVVTTQVQANLNRFSLLLDTNQPSQAEALLPQIRTQINRLPVDRSAIDAQINFAQNLIRLKQIDRSATPTWEEIAQIVAAAQEQAETLGDARAGSYALGILGEVYEQTQQWSIAQTLTTQALQTAQSIRDVDITYRWQWQLGRLRKAQGNIEGAIAAYNAAFDTLQLLRRDVVTSNLSYQLSFRQTAEQPIYRELIDLLLKSDNPTQNNLKRARFVTSSLQVAELENFLQEPCADTTPEETDRVVDQLAPNAAVIYPIVLPDRLEIIVKLPQEETLYHYHSFVSSDRLQQVIQQLQLDLEEEYTFAAVKAEAHQLYDWLILPARDDLRAKAVNTLVFALDSSLRTIPMAVLHDGTQYLMENYAIALVPGLALANPRPLQQNQLQVLAVGLTEPREDERGNFAKLTNVQPELEAIAAAGLPVTPIRDENFTRRTFNQEINETTFPIVHIATHGQFSSDPQDTFLLSYDAEIPVNDLNTLFRIRGQTRPDVIELLVLSACETAAGDELASLGIAGTAVRAGARSTIASLWTLDDAFSVEFARQLYQHLNRPGVSKAEALRRAQQFLLNNPQYEHPRYWATYILLGNWL